MSSQTYLLRFVKRLFKTSSASPGSDTDLYGNALQVFLFCSLYLVLVGILGFIMNSTVFWLYWKNKKVGKIILVILYFTLTF